MSSRSDGPKPGPSGFDAALEAALDPELEAEWATELEKDADASARLAGAKRVLEALDSLPRPEPSGTLRRGLSARLDDVDRRHRGFWASLWSDRWRVRVGASLAISGAVAALLVVRASDKPSVSDPALARLERLELAEDLDIFENLEVLQHLDVLDDLELIRSLPEDSG